MRITDLKVDGFGVWSGLELPELSDQLNVFYGPNEAGKTTLMQFVRSILYGFSPERRARYLPPVRAGRPGGTLQAVAGQKTYTITRHADEQGETGDVSLLSDGQPAVDDERGLSALLGAVDESIFNNVFAFGLREIQELGTLSDTQAADELYNLALGLDRVSLVDVLRELETSRNRLLAADDRPSLVTQLLSQRERLQGEIEDLGQSSARYLTLAGDRQKLADEVARLEAETAANEQQIRELSLARVLRERWQRRAAIDEQLASSKTFGALPDHALTRLDRLANRRAARQRRLRRLKDQRRALRAQGEQLKINESLCQQALRLEALAEQRQWIESLERQVGTLETEVLELETQREESFKQWGLKPDSRLAEPMSKRSLAELHSTAKSLRQTHRQLGEVRSQLEATAQAVSGSQRQVEGALGSAKEKGLTQALAEAGELVSKLRKRIQLDERLDLMSRRETELEEQSHEHLERQILPTWALAGLGCLFVLGCALVLLYAIGLILPISMSGSLGWPVPLIGLVASGAAGLIKFGMERAAAGQLDTCQQQIQLLAQQIKQARQDRDELDQQLPRGGGPLVARLQAAEKDLARLEELLPLESQRETARRESDSVQQQEAQLEAECRRLRKQWHRLLVEAGLPADLRPRQLEEFSRGRDQARGLSKLIEDKNAELNRRRSEYESLSGRITQLVGEVGVAPRSARPLDQLQQCLLELKEQQSRMKQREEVEKQIARLRRRFVKLSQGMDKLRQRRHLLLREAGTNDEQEFRRRAHAQAEAAQLATERAQIAQEISIALAGQCSEEKLAECLSAQPSLEQREAQLIAARQVVSLRLAEALEKRGELNQQLKTLVDDRQLPHHRIELGVVEKRLQDALERWRVLTLCGMMLEAVRQYYEREHQPQALREASTYLRRLTAGRYTRVWTPLGEHALKVDDSEGNCLPVEVLSRGTREQLFLALRLALIGAYGRRGVQLPLVLDDVLVNFDVGRAKAAAVVLRDFAKQGHQILIFTCHEHISKLFKNIKAEVRQLPDNAQPQSAIPDEQAAKRSRRTRPEIPVEPEPEPVFEPDMDEFETETLAVEAVKPAVAPPPAVPRPVSEEPKLAPPKPVPVPVAAPRQPPEPRPVRRIARSRWSAEEFEGELTDRVRRTETRIDADRGEASAVLNQGEDAEAA